MDVKQVTSAARPWNLKSSVSPLFWPGGRWRRKKYEQRHGEQLDGYYDDIISQPGLPEAVLIFGPGEAKLELKERLSRSKALSGCTVDLGTADRLTDPQIVAKVKDHFGIVR